MIRILPMKSEHLDQVMQIEEECFSIPWSRTEFENELINQLAMYFVICEDTEVVGYGGMWHVVTEGHITNIAVKPDKRRKGYGKLLMEKLISVGKKKKMIGLTLEVRMNNTNAQRLYTSYGFKPEGIRKNYYADTKEDAIIMWKYL